MRWQNQIAACIASGPSLTPEDCDMVRAAGIKAIVVNTSFRLAPWADVLYAGDRQWWQAYGDEAPEIEKWTASIDAAERRGINYRPVADWENSGMQAIELAVSFGATRIVLLGYDMQHTGGLRHWHPDHPEQMENADGIEHWAARFDSLPQRFPHVDLINCSRHTAIRGIRRMELTECLSRYAELATS